MTHNIKPLLIAGGFSTRKGTPKHLMPHSDGRPAYQHTLEHLMNALPLTDTFFISLRDQDQTLEMDLAGSHKISKHIEPIYDSTSILLGPAAGLVAAHICAPSATWLIVGCDYPLLTAHTLQQLMRESTSLGFKHQRRPTTVLKIGNEQNNPSFQYPFACLPSVSLSSA
ncbi:hypothetical protein HO173_013160 [Letharia columbiana]|uniref:MobA-like NTP transferase domain-containing protein n=1 Tax=Letharia columbiana TaxID=112416 RepID=A0A8H6CHX7_9LECA|nr:uncharacterized protein HO173_013160 [Letharia columbiana]KAF6223829.1 hypothetical protein HO173_013160 [Letharia columbiana]